MMLFLVNCRNKLCVKDGGGVVFSQPSYVS